METQLVRLDAPYNIIIGTNGEYALHIATLIMVRENKEGNLSVVQYPVVSVKGERAGYFVSSGIGNADGRVWMHSRLDDCYVVCPQYYPTLSINEFKDVMKYFAKLDMIDMPSMVATSFILAMKKYGCRFVLPVDENNLPIADITVCLEFEESNKGKSCMVFADDDSPFYFYEYFDNEPPFIQTVPTNSEAKILMAELRDTYLQAFRLEGVRSITFTTKNEKYQWFVDELNATKLDGEEV
jgi:hypothetical protein